MDLAKRYVAAMRNMEVRMLLVCACVCVCVCVCVCMCMRLPSFAVNIIEVQNEIEHNKTPLNRVQQLYPFRSLS